MRAVRVITPLAARALAAPALLPPRPALRGCPELHSVTLAGA